jgi:peptidoglycan lytic transglycosylase
MTGTLVASCQPFPDDPSRPAPGSRVPHPSQDPSYIPPDEPPSRGGNPTSYVVHGQRYYVMDSSVGYVERGIASWYGPGFHGRLTSNGERYDMDGLSAAHKSLQLPTWVQVTNLDNGLSIIVRVNDRGPFVDDRIIDLSRGAAEAIDMIGTGTALVEVRALTGMDRSSISRTAPSPVANQPVSAPSVARTAPGPAAPSGGQTPQPLGHEPQLWLQLGAFGDQTNARLLEDRIRSAGISMVQVDILQRDSGTLYRVRIGPVPGVPQFDQISTLLREHGIGEAQLVIE